MTGLTSTTTNTVAVITPKSGVGYFYPLPLDNSLGADVAAADSNNDASNIITLSISSIPYPVTGGQLRGRQQLEPDEQDVHHRRAG